MTQLRWPLLVCTLWLAGACSHISYEPNPRVSQPTGPVPLERVQVLEAAPDSPHEDIGEITLYLRNRSGAVSEQELLLALRKEASERGCERVHIRGRARKRSLPSASASQQEPTEERKKVRAACIRPLPASAPPAPSPEAPGLPPSQLSK